MHRITLVVLIILVSAPFVSAAGLGLSPSIFGVDDAGRGAGYVQHLKILNLNEGSQRATINATGDAAGWFSFVEQDSNTTLERVEIEGDSEYRFRAIITVPDDAPNGAYRGTIDVSPIIETENAANVIVQGVYTIQVTGAQTRNARVESVTVSDVESGQLVRFRYDVRNTGNVEVTTRARVEVSREGAIIDSNEMEGTPVNAGSFSTQELTWNSENWGVGNFTGNVRVFLDGTELADEDVMFALLPRGTYTAEAMVGTIEVPDGLEPKTVGKLTVPVYNTGKIDILAKVTSEVSKDGKLVETLSSEERLIPAGGSERIEYYFTPDTAGSYELSGKLIYSGKETVFEPVTVLVADPSSVNREGFNDTSAARSRYVVFGTLLIVAGLVAVIAIMGWQMSKR